VALLETSSSSSSDSNSDEAGSTAGSFEQEYMRVGLDRGVVSFSLQAVVEISRLNAFRISAIWQMVTSHLRMIASLKVMSHICECITHYFIYSSCHYVLNC
jgi:hypothetical protein